jgi:naphthoate synthase
VKTVEWQKQEQFGFEDTLYEKRTGVARISFNRPKVLNAFRTNTLREVLGALNDAWTDRTIGVVVLTGTGTRAFSTGADMVTREPGGYSGAGGGLTLPELHAEIIRLIRTIPKPVIAAVNGYAIGGGHVFHLVCDLSIAADTARFGQVGPKYGSFDAGFGSAYLAHVVGEKKAREIWYLCRQYSAQEALQMGLVNMVVPADKLEEEVDKVCNEILARSPYSIAMLKQSINGSTDYIWGLHHEASLALKLYYGTEESREGTNAFLEKRAPDFSRFRIAEEQ